MKVVQSHTHFLNDFDFHDSPMHLFHNIWCTGNGGAGHGFVFSNSVVDSSGFSFFSIFSLLFLVRPWINLNTSVDRLYFCNVPNPGAPLQLPLLTQRCARATTANASGSYRYAVQVGTDATRRATRRAMCVAGPPFLAFPALQLRCKVKT